MTDRLRMAALRKTDVRVLCPGCETFVPLWHVQYDHHLALVDGGKHDEENVRVLCQSQCHAKKSAYEHRANAKAKRIVRKNSGQDAKPKRRIQGRALPLRGRTSWPETSPPLQSRSFQKRRPTAEAAE